MCRKRIITSTSQRGKTPSDRLGTFTENNVWRDSGAVIRNVFINFGGRVFLKRPCSISFYVVVNTHGAKQMARSEANIGANGRQIDWYGPGETKTFTFQHSMDARDNDDK